MAKGDMFLLVEGQRTGAIKGEALDKVHMGEIDVMGWSWGMTSQAAMGGAGSGLKTSLSELKIAKMVDRASTALMSVMRSGEVVKKAVLTVVKGGPGRVEYFKLMIEGGRITSLELGSPSGPELTEHLTIAFEKIEVEYFETDEQGGRKGASTFITTVR
jgi:type VI secretion system secreted protein Hcp